VPKALRFSPRLVVSLCSRFLNPCAAFPQITKVANHQCKPAVGAGRDYIGMVNETLNPANGPGSFRLGMTRAA
jgi:hypothetical protein